VNNKFNLGRKVSHPRKLKTMKFWFKRYKNRRSFTGLKYFGMPHTTLREKKHVTSIFSVKTTT